MATKLSAAEFADALENMFNEYKREVNEGMNKAVDETGDELIDAIRRDARRRTGKYAKTPAKKDFPLGLGRKKIVIHFKKPGWRLAHLLNNPHRTRSGKTVPGDGHITKNAEIAGKSFEVKVKAVIERAGS